MPVFKTGAFNRSAISPHRVYHAGAGLEPLPSPGHEPGELTRALPRAHQALRSPHTLLPSVDHRRLPSTTVFHRRPPLTSLTRPGRFRGRRPQPVCVLRHRSTVGETRTLTGYTHSNLNRACLPFHHDRA